MDSLSTDVESACDLESVLATAQLDRRPSRRSDSARETQALLSLMRDFARYPRDFFQKLVDAALALSGAGSTGISLLDEETRRFVWPAVAGELNSFIGGGTPSDFGPCGTVLERDTSLLFIHPERYFTYLAPIAPPLEEVLLIPFHMDRRAVGTLWAVLHNQERKFDAEDRRLLESLSEFAADAYRALVSAGALKSFIETVRRP